MCTQAKDAFALAHLDVEASLRSSTISRRTARATHWAPSCAAATCLMQTSNPTVARPSGTCSSARLAAQRSIIAIMPGVERTRTGIVPRTSVSRRFSTVKGSSRIAIMVADPSSSTAGRLQ
jgi:hypothetical protein